MMEKLVEEKQIPDELELISNIYNEIDADALELIAQYDPALYAEFKARVHDQNLKRERNACEASLLTFVRRAW